MEIAAPTMRYASSQVKKIARPVVKQARRASGKAQKRPRTRMQVIFQIRAARRERTAIVNVLHYSVVAVTGESELLHTDVFSSTCMFSILLSVGISSQSALRFLFSLLLLLYFEQCNTPLAGKKHRALLQEASSSPENAEVK